MKVCITEHHVAGFGDIPAGSLWDDDSPFVQKSECFALVVDEAPKPAPAKKATRKFGAVVAEVADAPTETEER